MQVETGPEKSDSIAVCYFFSEPGIFRKQRFYPLHCSYSFVSFRMGLFRTGGAISHFRKSAVFAWNHFPGDNSIRCCKAGLRFDLLPSDADTWGECVGCRSEHPLKTIRNNTIGARLPYRVSLRMVNLLTMDIISKWY